MFLETTPPPLPRRSAPRCANTPSCYATPMTRKGAADGTQTDPQRACRTAPGARRTRRARSTPGSGPPMTINITVYAAHSLRIEVRRLNQGSLCSLSLNARRTHNRVYGHHQQRPPGGARRRNQHLPRRRRPAQRAGTRSAAGGTRAMILRRCLTPRMLVDDRRGAKLNPRVLGQLQFETGFANRLPGSSARGRDSRGDRMPQWGL